jgi:hypothetical protein
MMCTIFPNNAILNPLRGFMRQLVGEVNTKPYYLPLGNVELVDELVACLSVWVLVWE